MAQHAPRFLQIVNDARGRVKETNVDDVKARSIAARSSFSWTSARKANSPRDIFRRRAHRQRRHRTRHRSKGSRHEIPTAWLERSASCQGLLVEYRWTDDEDHFVLGHRCDG